MHGFQVLSPLARSIGSARTPLLRATMSGSVRKDLLHYWQPHLHTPSRFPSLQRPYGFPRAYSTPSGTPSVPKPSVWSRFFPLVSRDSRNVSSFRKIIALAKPERKSLGIAICLLLVSSAVSMSIPFTVGKLIDYFTSPNPVCCILPLGS